MNYDIVVQGLTNHFFPPNEIQHKKRFILWDLFNPQDSKIHKFICHINSIIQYLDNFPPFGMSQQLPDDKKMSTLNSNFPRSGINSYLFRGSTQLLRVLSSSQSSASASIHTRRSFKKIIIEHTKKHLISPVIYTNYPCRLQTRKLGQTRL